MNLECPVCTARKIGSSFHSLDDLQAHLFSNHHDGPLDLFQFVCQNCEFKFATEYRLLRHEETCGGDSRSEEDMEKIRYKLQMYELLEATIKYNMTKHQISGARPANPSHVETSEIRERPQTQYQTESLGTKRIKSEILESLENTVTNSRQKNNAKNGSAETAGASPSVITNESTENLVNLRTVKAEVQVQNCSSTSASSTQSNVKTEPEDVDASEVEVLGTVEIRKRKAPSKSAEHISQRSEGNAQQNVNLEGEISNLRHSKQAKTNLVSEEPVRIPVIIQGTSNARSRTSGGIPLWKQYLLGSANVDKTQILRFNSIRDQEERMTTSNATNLNAANMTNRIFVTGPLLYPQEMDPKTFQKEEFRTYFGQFGKVNVVGYSLPKLEGIIAFNNCESAAKCIQQGTHTICGQDFVVRAGTPTRGMKDKIRADLCQNMTGLSSSSQVHGIDIDCSTISRNVHRAVAWQASTNQVRLLYSRTSE
ncbi:hypothetical protein DdX_20294 [Ditylenchus destructor]|uniref:RRM domain-containing protein n=1 Tax=Ditylenchus destructor TaxID=166010 RepID=A0AAD4MHF3_9BILA|nr:hypothetical protein DdX_20294 [Ditylenchus destructor]